MNEKVIGAIASALHTDAQEFAAALKDGDKWLAEDELAEVISQKISEQVRAAKEDQRKRGQREVWSSVEKKLKAQGFDNAEKLQGVALLETFFENFKTESEPDGKKPAEMTDAELAKLPAVKSLIAKVKADAGKEFEAVKTELEQRAMRAETTQKKLVVGAEMAKLLEGAKINLGDNAETRAARLRMVESQIPFDRLNIENDKIVFSDADGFEADFKKFVLDIAQPAYGIVKQDPNKGGANPPQAGPNGAAGGDGKHVRKYTFANASEYEQARLTAPVTEHYQMRMDWKLQQEEMAAGK